MLWLRLGFSSNLPHEHSVAPGRLPPCRRNHRASGGAAGAGIGKRRGEPQGMAMNRSRVVAMGLALAAGAMLWHPALAQSPFPPAPQQSSPWPAPPQQSAVCANFPKLRDEAKAKAELVSTIGKKHGDRKEMCAAVPSPTRPAIGSIRWRRPG